MVKNSSPVPGRPSDAQVAAPSSLARREWPVVKSRGADEESEVEERHAERFRQDPVTGIYLPRDPVRHCDEQYDPALFGILVDMQRRHFWYRGRHRFLLAALERAIRSEQMADRALRAIDVGGGCGGWLQYVQQHGATCWRELALADSSQECLVLARDVVGEHVRRYWTDLRTAAWQDEWDIAFLLDVLEHLPDDVVALQQAARVLRPGGLLIVTVPALNAFWSLNDVLVGHVRRYSKGDFAALAARTGLTLCDARYFMFLLSPLLLLRRRRSRDSTQLSAEQKRRLIQREHRVPPVWLNRLLEAVFAAETPLGLWCPFPWGTSLLGIFRKGA